MTTYDAVTIMCKLLQGAPDGKNYRLAAMYIEFENNSGAEVTPPTYDRSGAAEYYSSLGTDPVRDYLRVPIVNTALESSDTDNYPDGNKLTLFAQTTGSEGVHGKPFSHTVQSRVYGAALVAVPDEDDHSQDIVHSRVYFDAENQRIKEAGSQISVPWPLTLT